MDQNQCNDLRDLLFASRFQTNQKERMFRLLAVESGGVGDSEATVHFAYAPATWERAGYIRGTNEVAAILKAAISETLFRERRIAIQFHDYLRYGWPISWTITAKDSSNNFPLLILRELANGRVAGVLMREGSFGSAEARFAAEYAEPDEAKQVLVELDSLSADECFLGTWYKECNIAADSLAAAIAATPETEHGQKHVLLYSGVEWLSGLWNNPSKPHAMPISLNSVADFHGIRASEAKRCTRSGLEVTRLKQTIVGDYAVLDCVVGLLNPEDGQETTNYEEIPAVRSLCEWWNANAPEAMRSAAAFRIYTWEENDKIFVAGDPEEPAIQSDALAGDPSYALFESEGRPSVAVKFYRGRAFNTESEWGTQTYSANGEEAWQIGADIDEVDEAYYSVVGLRALQKSSLQADEAGSE